MDGCVCGGEGEGDNVQCMLPLGRFGTFVSALGFGFVPKFPIDLIYMQNI